MPIRINGNYCDRQKTSRREPRPVYIVLWTVLGYVVAVIALVWLFFTTSCSHAETAVEYKARTEHAECVGKWLKHASEAPTCQSAIAQLAAMTDYDPKCADSLADAGSVLVLVCEEPKP